MRGFFILSKRIEGDILGVHYVISHQVILFYDA